MNGRNSLSNFANPGKITSNFLPSWAKFWEKLNTIEKNVILGDPNTFEEFLEPEEYMDHRHLFIIDQPFNSKIELVDWAKEMTMKVNTYLIVTRYLRSKPSKRRPYFTLACDRGEANKSRTKWRVDEEEEEEVPIKGESPYGTKKCG
ncbi:hypothetical protein M9H77_27306 [Catharanthus roseus]|uniref:Uncharacterized protein n=1 Tax=Catharanthus roseus TaxID=4058 RepID=A0ACC0AC44_CATRO|nr:hypothetical protein M9H77_27306 [Catharanthus roseus]